MENEAETNQTLLLTKKGEVSKQFYRVNWPNLITIVLHHALGLWGLCAILRGEAQWQTVVFGAILSTLALLGTTVGAHRLWSHRCYQAKWRLKILLMIWQTLAGQDTIWKWAAWHRLHHKFTDTPLDPHDATRGFWYSHVGWLILYDHAAFLEQQKKIPMEDLNQDPVVMWQQRNYCWLYPFIGFLLPMLIPWTLWDETLWLGFLCGGHLRWTITSHETWCINSVAHLWGYKPYDKSIRPVNNLFASIVAYGEGWHNYHHTFPWDYKASELGLIKHWNPSTALIHLFARIGWAYDLRSASKDMVEVRKLKNM